MRVNGGRVCGEMGLAVGFMRWVACLGRQGRRAPGGRGLRGWSGPRGPDCPVLILVGACGACLRIPPGPPWTAAPPGGPDAPGYSSCWPWGAGTRAGPGVLLLAGLLADDLAGSSKAAALRGRLGHSGVVGGGDRHVVEWRGVPATWVAGRGDSAQADGEVSASRQAASLLSNEAAAWAGLVEGNARYCSGADGRPGSTWRR